MTTIEQEEKRFEALSSLFYKLWWCAMPRLSIEEDTNDAGYVATAYIGGERQRIVIQRSCNPDLEDSEKSITLALKKLNDRLEARLNGKVE